VTLSLSGVLWVNGTTDINVQSAYNDGLQRISDWANAHGSNTTVGTTPPDQHNTQAIQVPSSSISIGQSSGNTTTTLDVFLAEITTRIHNIEGNGADWATGSAATTLATIYSAITGHTIIAASAVGNAATATTAAALTTPQPIDTTLSDYKASASGSNATISVAPGGAYVDPSTGFYVAADGSTRTVTLPTQPVGAGVFEYCWITKPPVAASGLVSVPHSSTTGVAGTTPAVPAYPTGELPIALVIWRASAPGGVVAAADIIDIRALGGAGGAGTGGGTYVPASPIVAVGASGSTFQLDLLLSGGDLANVTPYNGVTPANIRITEKLISDSYQDASLEDYLSVAVSGDILGALAGGGTTLALTVASNKPPITVKVNGKRQRIDPGTTITPTGSVPANSVAILVADLSGTGPNLTTKIIAGGSTLSAYQVALVQAWYDGSFYYIFAPHGPLELTKPKINGLNFQPIRQVGTQATSSGALAISATIVQITNVPLLTIDLPDGAFSARVDWKCQIVAPSPAGQFYTSAMISSGAGVAVAGAGDVMTATDIPVSSASTRTHWTRFDNRGPGPFNVSLGYITTVAGYVVNSAGIEVEITR
jgi:hypothetical protein